MIEPSGISIKIFGMQGTHLKLCTNYFTILQGRMARRDKNLWQLRSLNKEHKKDKQKKLQVYLKVDVITYSIRSKAGQKLHAL